MKKYFGSSVHPLLGDGHVVDEPARIRATHTCEIGSEMKLEFNLLAQCFIRNGARFLAPPFAATTAIPERLIGQIFPVLI